MASVGAERQPAGLGFALRDPWAWPDFAGLARLGEDLGYAGVFLPEITGRDALVALAALAAETERLWLGTGVLPMGSRHPLLTAMAAATLDERSGGRAILGLGTGPAVAGASDRLRRMVEALRLLFAGEPVTWEGRRIRLAAPMARPVPIWIAALGPRAVRLAGEIADGVLLNWCTPERVAEAVAAGRGSAVAAGRDPGELTVAVYVRANLAEPPDAAVDVLRPAAGEYASYPAYARQFEAMGLGEEARRGATAHAAGRPDEVPEELVRAVALVGPAAQARERLEAYRAAGADLPVVYPVVDPDAGPGPVAATLRALAPRV
jgi:alkanesulfonate monooxygenase SsuD/methylene tetrahydromethanopterin reductase-like flavin-dependent oxidoreductase (luciferase family)